jgi:multiple sugar transport system permease protein
MMWQLYMAASVLVLIPVAITFLLLQRHFVEGLSMSGIKN